MSIKQDHLLNPITALEFYHCRSGALLVLAGEGSFLKIFDAKESQLLHKCEVFQDQAIHGIAIRDEVAQGVGLQLVVWGASSVTLVTKYEFDLILGRDVSSITGTAISVSDWILDAAISPFDNVGCVLVTAHNTVIQARLGHPNHPPLLQTLHSPSKSILYSAHLAWESSSCIMVAAGTVFGEIVVWQCFPSNERVSVGSRILFTFTGHEGSIFGVHISPPIVGLGNVTRLLASCSDDRTIRVWNLNPNSNGIHVEAAAVLARETGFSQIGTSGESYMSETPHMAMMMGHASRIWQVRFLGDQSCPLDSSAINILSFGEDSTTQQWALDVEASTEGFAIRPHVSARLNRLKILAFHSGKHIWSTASRQAGNSKAILATGGADGKIALYDLRVPCSVTTMNSTRSNDARSLYLDVHALVDHVPWSSSWELDEVLKTPELKRFVQSSVSEQTSSNPSCENSPETTDGKPAKKKAKKIPKDAFNRYAFVSESEILITTTFGRVLLCRLDFSVQWDEISLPKSATDNLRSYAVVLGFPEMGLVCLAGAKGQIYVYYRRQIIVQLRRVEGKVADMFKIYDPRTESFELLVTTLGGTAATLFSFDFAGPGVHLTELRVYILPEKFIVTSAGMNENLLVLGSRSGSLALYATTKPDSALKVWTSPAGTLRDAITTVTNLPASSSDRDSDSEYFLTTSRDGFYSIFSTNLFRDSNIAISDVQMHQIHQGTPPFGPMVEAGWFEGKELVLYGFKGKNFVVWNETAQCEITNVECGGSHRSYAYSPLRGSAGGYFVYTKASKMYLHSHGNSSHQIVKPGGHGREIKACAVADDQSLFATGAEDTTIRIWQYDKLPNLGNPLHCQAIIQRHSAGIQHLRWHGSTYLFSSGGNEEFFIWAVEQIPGFGIGVFCEATCPDPSENRDLRIMSFDVTELSTSCGHRSAPYLLISLAYSDSTIRTYTYSKHNIFHLVAIGKYTSSCITQICHNLVQDDEIAILTAATDGKLTFWKGYFNEGLHNGVSKPVHLVAISNQRIHQNAIKSLDVMKFEDHILVAAGGDDNALSISFYPISNSIATLTATCFVLKSAHAAAITGLCFIHNLQAENREDIKIVSSGNDQRVKSWAVRMYRDLERGFFLEIEKAGDAYTPVADVGDVAAIVVGRHSNQVLIVGNGMEFSTIFGQNREASGQ